ncbi:palmitoyltransferase ZDHHC4 isoform X3 [Manacus candei]|uniref:palmitoyltransferase ZDHHC4 isoform X3 n=1 Tax=Manacus candei TaxID=415023 RepID=UPI002227047E|nr:palmitoyltransferase ZDHHC4 isoform X3 [Manacus candei]
MCWWRGLGCAGGGDWDVLVEGTGMCWWRGLGCAGGGTGMCWWRDWDVLVEGLGCATWAGAAPSPWSVNPRPCCRDPALGGSHSCFSFVPGLGMDFLTLFLVYLCFVLLVTALLCLCSGRKESFLARSVTRASQVLSLVIPTQLQRVAHRVAHGALHRLFHTRSCLFVVLHIALQAAVFGEYTWEVFGYCWELQFHLLLLLLPYLLLAGNMGCFLLCSRANPGIITKSNHASLVKVYAYDGVMFQRGTVCPTCTLEKPARCVWDVRASLRPPLCVAQQLRGGLQRRLVPALPAVPDGHGRCPRCHHPVLPQPRGAALQPPAQHLPGCPGPGAPRGDSLPRPAPFLDFP